LRDRKKWTGNGEQGAACGSAVETGIWKKKKTGTVTRKGGSGGKNWGGTGERKRDRARENATKKKEKKRELVTGAQGLLQSDDRENKKTE